MVYNCTGYIKWLYRLNFQFPFCEVEKNGKNTDSGTGPREVRVYISSSVVISMPRLFE